MSELPPIKLPRANIGDEVIVTSEETGQVWNIVSTNKAKTRRRFRAMTAGTTPPPPPPPPVPSGTVVTPTNDIRAMLAQGIRSFVLRAGTYYLSFGSTDTAYKDVSIAAYPGEKPVIVGSGAESFVYLGVPSGTWKLTDLEIRNFLPEDQGVIGIGAGGRIESTRVKMVGSGIASGNNDHGYYFHDGTGLIVDPDVTGFPGSALQSYRGTPDVDVTGGRLWGMTVGVYCYSGHMDITGTDIRGGGTYDIDVQSPATATLTGCTGRAANGAPKRYDHS